MVSDQHVISLPSPCSIRHVATHLFDFQSVPRRSFFEILSWFAVDELEKEKLEDLSSSQGQEELFSYCNRPRRTIVEALCDFPLTAANIPFTYLFDLIPYLQPRAFSIASSLQCHPNRVQILMAVVSYKTRLIRPRQGVCTSWLASIIPK
jgi:sulfite reductase alpha subunit-like flavoprotein